MYVLKDDESTERQMLKDLSNFGLSKRIDGYLNLIMQNRGKMLTDALKSVLNRIDDKLEWKQERNSKVSFSSFDEHGDCYTINSLTGTLLINGYPPHQLPATITNDKLYQKILFDNNFEVVTKSGYFENVQPVFSSYYRFFKSNDKLVVQDSLHESYAQNSALDVWAELLELLSLTKTQCLHKYPLKLQSSYSHWISRNHNNLLLLCSFDFRKRKIYYIKGADADMKCVPEYTHEREKLVGTHQFK